MANYPDWNQSGSASRRYTVVIGRGRGLDPRSIGFAWAGRAGNICQAKAKAMADADMTWRVLLAFYGKKPVPFPYTIQLVTSEDMSYSNFIGIGKHAYVALGETEGDPSAVGIAEEHVVAAADAAMRCDYKKAVLPTESADVWMDYGWRNHEEISKVLILTTHVLVKYHTQRLDTFSVHGPLRAVAIAAAMAKSYFDFMPRSTAPIEVPRSATLRAAAVRWRAKPTSDDVAIVCSFLSNAGLALEAKAFTRAYE